MGMSWSYGPPKDKEEMIALLRAAVDRGVTSFDPALPNQVKRAIMGEKYDVFVALARRHWDAATAAFEKLESDPVRDALRPALLKGRIDSGVSREEAAQMVEHL